MPDDSPNGTMRMWAEAAAKAVAQVSGLAETVASVLHARALRSFAEGIRQYLAVRLASVDEADTQLLRLRERAAEWPADELVAPPGARARLYREARRLADEVRMERSLTSEARAALPWRAAQRGQPLVYGEALKRLRTSLDDDDADTLELRHARELAVDEVAFVRGEDEEVVVARLERAEKFALEIVGPAPRSRIPGLHGALIDAFELTPPTAPAKSKSDEIGFEAGTMIGGRYQLEKRVGAGSFGDVYRASDTEVAGHVVALKILHQPSLSETAKASATRELRLIASVFHPSIVQFKDHGWFAGRLWFVMPWYEGETLEARIRRDPLTRAEARVIFEPLASALTTMHASGIRHQDIKPDNIFLARLAGGEGKDEVLPVLLDLGVAAKEAEMVLAGTPMYFAPEVAAQFSARSDRQKPTVAADVFALGLSLRNALEPETAEEVPGAAIETFIAYRADHAPSAPGSKDAAYLRPAFARWLAHEPERRPTAAEFLRELALLTAPEERRERTLRTLRWLLPLVLTVTTVFASVLYVVRKNAEVAAVGQRRVIATVRADLAIQEAKNEALLDDNSALARRYATGELNRDQLSALLATKEAQIRHLGSQFDRAGDREARLRTELTQTTERLTQTATELAAAHDQLAASESHLHDATDQLARAQQTINERERAAADAVAELAAQRQQADAVRVDRDRLSRQVQELAGQVQQTQSHVDELGRQLTTAQTERDRARAQLADLEQQLAQLRAQAAPRNAPPAPAPPGP